MGELDKLPNSGKSESGLLHGDKKGNKPILPDVYMVNNVKCQNPNENATAKINDNAFGRPGPVGSKSYIKICH